MSSNAKYQPAPQRDSFEESNYTQPPPSYQAEASTNAALLGGIPRGEDDNVPDDFKVSLRKRQAKISGLESGTANLVQVWRICRGGHSRHPDAVHP